MRIFEEHGEREKADISEFYKIYTTMDGSSADTFFVANLHFFSVLRHSASVIIFTYFPTKPYLHINILHTGFIYLQLKSIHIDTN